MKRLSSSENGSLVPPLIIVTLLLFVALGFGAWSFMGLQDYKNNSDIKAAAAAKQATDTEALKKDAQFAEAEKSPLKTFTSSETFGSLTFQYPKTWSLYESKTTTAKPLDNFFNPNSVPDEAFRKPYALRLQVVDVPYITILKGFDKSVASAESSMSAFRFVKVPSVLGSMVKGPVGNSDTGTMVLVPLRDKTLILWTEGTSNSADFVNSVLPSVSFTP
jgi:hypothetical protein